MDGLWLTFAYSWMLAAAYYFLADGPTPEGNLVFGIVYMWVPGLIALYLSRKESKPIAWKTALNADFLKACLWPIAIVLIAVLFSLLWGTLEGFSELREEIPYFQDLSEPYYSLSVALVLTVVAIATGCTINMAAALGEELMWRGYLFNYYSKLSRWSRDLRIGFWWGLWHAPVLLIGNSFPQWPIAGMAIMVIFCVCASPILGYLRDRTNSVLPSAIFHGTFNAISPLIFLVFAPPHQPLIVSPTGLTTSLAILALILICPGLRNKSSTPQVSPV